MVMSTVAVVASGIVQINYILILLPFFRVLDPEKGDMEESTRRVKKDGNKGGKNGAKKPSCYL